MEYKDIDWELHDWLKGDRAAFFTSFTEEEKLAVFRNDMITSRDDIAIRVDSLIEAITDSIVECSPTLNDYYQRRVNCLSEFKYEISRTALFDSLEPWWSYTIEVSSRGVRLRLEHAGPKKIIRDDHRIFTVPDTSFILVDHRVKAMTLDEYSEYSKRSIGATRQLLRRGKLRTAYKIGSEWRIPELTSPVVEKRFSFSSYMWDIELADIPDEFHYMKKANSIEISRDKENPRIYQLFVMNPEGVNDHYFKITNEERERLEFYLIGNSYVTYTDDTYKFRYKLGDAKYEKMSWE